MFHNICKRYFWLIDCLNRVLVVVLGFQRTFEFQVFVGIFRRGLVKKQFSNLFSWIGFAALLAVLVFGVQVGAQVISGDLVGTVYDKTGAVVPNASVEVLNVATG